MRIFMFCYEKRVPQLSYGAHVTSATSQAAWRIARWLRLRSEIRFVLPFIGCEILLPSYSVAVKSRSPPYQKGWDAVRLSVNMDACYRYPLNPSMVHPKSESVTGQRLYVGALGDWRNDWDFAAVFRVIERD